MKHHMWLVYQHPAWSDSCHHYVVCATKNQAEAVVRAAKEQGESEVDYDSIQVESADSADAMMRHELKGFMNVDNLDVEPRHRHYFAPWEPQKATGYWTGSVYYKGRQGDGEFIVRGLDLAACQEVWDRRADVIKRAEKKREAGQ